MRSFKLKVSNLLVALCAFTLITTIEVGAGPTPLKRAEYRASPGGKVEGSYIVTLKPTRSSRSCLSWLDQTFNIPSSQVTHSNWDPSLLNGFAGRFSPEEVEKLRDNEDVEAIAEDGIMRTQAVVTQTNAPWGLARISRDTKLSGNPAALNYTYQYDSTAGKGVDIYVVDTGILANHSEFGGRAREGKAFGFTSSLDGNGHGTHCAATAAGARYGVAKAANIIGIKVLDDEEGAGSIADIISGLNYVLNSTRVSGRPSIASMSFGGGLSKDLDKTVRNLIGAGVHCIVAAGNDNDNADNYSPARVKEAITVGATTIADAKASFSNWGPTVDIWAPGEDIISAWVGGKDATNMIDGTSMATPHVAGLLAYSISRVGNSSPAQAMDYLHRLGLDGILQKIRRGDNNEIVRNDIPLGL